MPQNGPQDENADGGYERRTVLTGAGALAAGGLLGSSGVASATPEREPGPKKDELVLGISASAPDVASEARAAVPGHADVVHANETIRYATVSFPSEAPAHAREQFIEAIERAEHVEYVERNATVQSFGEPDDTYYGYQSAPQQVNCETAWETTTGSEDVLIATIDQGVQYDHPDLEGAVDDRVGEDVAGRGSDPYPSGSDEQHGTHVAGIAVAETDNGRGTAGISDCSLLAVRALDASGQGSLSDIADGIQWAADAGADVINLSLGAPDDYRTMAAACEYAEEQGALIVGAAGNAGADGVAYPAAYEDVIGVSALEGESLADFSNTGPEIDLAAPGTGLVSPIPWDDYGRMTGTSMATPVVAGVAGLALSAHPALTPTNLREHLRGTATDLGLEATAQGAGRVDAAAAVATDPYPDENADGTDDAGQCGDETVRARADGSLSGGWWGESDRYMYTPRTADPCSATITLEGPAGGDFDLYLNVDGESPTRWNHDESSAGDGASEAIDLELSGDEDLRIQIHANTGSGSYTLRIEERGR